MLVRYIYWLVSVLWWFFSEDFVLSEMAVNIVVVAVVEGYAVFKYYFLSIWRNTASFTSLLSQPRLYIIKCVGLLIGDVSLGWNDPCIKPGNLTSITLSQLAIHLVSHTWQGLRKIRLLNPRLAKYLLTFCRKFPVCIAFPMERYSALVIYLPNSSLKTFWASMKKRRRG